MWVMGLFDFRSGLIGEGRIGQFHSKLDEVDENLVTLNLTIVDANYIYPTHGLSSLIVRLAYHKPDYLSISNCFGLQLYFDGLWQGQPQTIRSTPNPLALL